MDQPADVTLHALFEHVSHYALTPLESLFNTFLTTLTNKCLVLLVRAPGCVEGCVDAGLVVPFGLNCFIIW